MIFFNRPFTIEAQAMFRHRLDDLYSAGKVLDICSMSGRSYPVKILSSRIDYETGALTLRVRRLRKWWRW